MMKVDMSTMPRCVRRVRPRTAARSLEGGDVGDDEPVASTLVLTRTQLRGCVDLPVLAAEMRRALGATSSAVLPQRVRTAPSESVTAMVLVPGIAADVPAYTVKVHAKNPDRRPALTGIICLHDSTSGDLLALLDSGWLTALRTGVGAALGADVLARADARRVGVIGAGAQGRAQLDALATLRNLERVYVHDVDPEAAGALVEHARSRHGLTATTSRDSVAVAAACDLLLVATWSRTPVLTARQVSPGTHVTSVGADEPGKVELDHDLLAAALVVTDDQALAVGVLPRTDATLGQILRGQHPGRQGDDDITVYSPVGLPLQDCVVAWHAYRSAVAAGVGTVLDLER